MKKGVKVFGALVLAVAIGAGGYFAGQKMEQRKSEITTAMPKQAMDMQKGQGNPETSPMQSNKPDASKEPKAEAPAEAVADRTISKLTASAVDGSWTKVSSNSLNGGTLTLYTSAEKDEKGFLWDDSQKWVLEYDNGNGGYYTLYDQLITNGRVYYDVASRDSGKIIITVYTASGSGTTVMQYTETDDGFVEKSVYNSGATNKIFSSIPDYR